MASASVITQVLSSPNTLYVTSIFSLLIARGIASHVKKYGPVSFARGLTKCNSIGYAIFSLLLCIGISTSLWRQISSISNPTMTKFICTTPSSDVDDYGLRLVFHASKLYEYIDIFNVLATGGVINAHFGIHHFTTPYVTYARVITYPAGWKIPAALNTLHHAFMYAYFGGAGFFSHIIPWTGFLQLTVGILAELYVVSDIRSGGTECGNPRGLWANGLVLGLMSTYAILFVWEVKGRGKKGKQD